MSKKIVSMMLALSTIVWMTGLTMLAPSAQAVTINEGDLIRGPDGIKVYIVNDKGYKRHIFNPEVFNMYGHFSWESIKDVSQDVLDSYTTSDLYRADGDPKVYSLEEVNEASGNAIKHWIDMTAAEFVDQGYSWDQVFVVNATERDYYSTGDPLTTGGTPNEPTDGALSVTAQSMPASGVLPLGASNVEYLKFKVTADEDSTIDEITVKREGVGATSDFSKVYLYKDEDRLTSGRTLSSDTNLANFVNLGIDLNAGESKIYTIIATMATGASAGDVNYLSLTDIDAGDATVSGLPISGTQYSLAASSAGTFTIETAGTPANPTVGDTDAVLAKFKIDEVANEDIAIERIALTNSGNVNLDEIENWSLYQGSDEVAATVSLVGDVVTFDFDEAYVIDEGDSRIFQVKGDLTGGVEKNDTIDLYLDETLDVKAIGQSYGCGATLDTTPTSGSHFNDTNNARLTVQGGTLTLSSSGPSATDIKQGGNDVVFMDFTMSAETDLDIEQMAVILTAGNTSTHQGLIYSGSTYNISDVKIRKTSGSTVMGPSDLSGSNDTTETLTFTDTFSMSAGETTQFQVTADTYSSVADASEFYVTLDVSGITAKDSDNNTVATGDIVPSSDIAGKTMTVNTSQLTVSMSSTPASDTLVESDTDVESAGFLFTAGEASDVTITDLTVTIYTDDDDSGAFVIADTGATVQATDILASMSLYDSDGLVKGPESIDTSSTDAYTTFTGLDWTIPAGETKKLTAKVDLGSNLTTDWRYALDINDTTDVTAEDEDGDTVDLASADPNSATSPDVYMTVRGYGTLTATQGDKPVEAILLDGQENTFNNIKFSSRYEAWEVQKMTFITTAGTAEDFDSVTISYPTEDGTTRTQSSNFSASDSVTFTGMTLYVPKDDDAILTVKGDFALISGSATSGDQPGIDFDVSGTFKAVGNASGVSKEDPDNASETGAAFAVATSDIASNDMTIRAAKPTVTNPTTAPATFSNATNQTIYKFRVEADEDGDTVDLYEFDFSVATSAGVLMSSWDLYNITEGTAGQWSCSQSSTTVTCTSSNTDEVSAGGYEDFKLTATISGGSTDDYISTYMLSDSSHVANAAADSVTGTPNIVWSDESASSHTASTEDWTNGHLINDADAYGSSQVTYYPITS